MSARHMLWVGRMDMTQRVALAKRLEAVEVELQRAMRGMDGSPEARTRLAWARAEYREAEQLALAVLAQDGLQQEVPDEVAAAAA